MYKKLNNNEEAIRVLEITMDFRQFFFLAQLVWFNTDKNKWRQYDLMTGEVKDCENESECLVAYGLTTKWNK